MASWRTGTVPRLLVLLLLLQEVAGQQRGDINIGGDGAQQARSKSRKRILTSSRAKEDQQQNRELESDYPAANPDFYVQLRSYCYATAVGDPSRWIKISQSDLEDGTYRIKKGGCYYLDSDIEFEPNGDCCDYWPKFDTSNNNAKDYPMGPFSLGFFAAITIEADDVVLDFAGHTLSSTLEFSLKQRFFNVIELASRVFEAHDGMPSLNLQNGEKLIIQGKENTDALRAADPEGKIAELASDIADSEKLCPRQKGFVNQPNRPPNRVIIRNGVIGRSSHNAIHGNGGPTNIMIEDLHVKDFEIAGIQFNGAKNITIRHTVVGPSGKALVLGTFASARFIGFWFAFFWKRYWTADEKKVLLKENYIKFSDRPNKVSCYEVFKRLFQTEHVLSEYLLEQAEVAEEGATSTGPPPGSLEALDPSVDEVGAIIKDAKAMLEDPQRAGELKAVLADGLAAFANPTGLPDGGAMYGINFHRRRKGVHRVGADVWNFYGLDEDSTTGVVINNVTIQGLKNHPLHVPALAHSQGGILNGPTGEVIRVADMADYSGQFSLRRSASYRGSVYFDALIAFYKVANDFWQYSVWGITPYDGLYTDDKVTCGNNPFITTNPSSITCPYDLPQSPKGPRKCDDPVTLQKRFFGGMKLSPEFYAWATSNLTEGLHTLMSSNDTCARKQTAHRVACGGDTMFHRSKGLFGLKVDFAADVVVKDVTISDLTNSADRNHWFCDREWRLYEANNVGPSTPKDYGGADVTGAVVTKAFGAQLKNVSIDGLWSEEGIVNGVDLIGDENGRSMYRKPYVPTVVMTDVDVGSNVRAGYPGMVFPLVVDTTYIDLGGFTSNEGTNLQNNWMPPRASLTLFSDFTTPTLGKYLSSSDITAALRSAGISEMDLQRHYGYLTTHYGINPYDADNGIVGGDPVGQRHYVQSICFLNSTCMGPWTSSEVMDIYYSVVVPPSWDLKGAFAGSKQKVRLQAGWEIRSGLFIVRNLASAPIVIHYYASSPEAQTNNNYPKAFPFHKAIDYDTWSAEFGFGHARGIETWLKVDRHTYRSIGSLQFSFDDRIKNFQITAECDKPYKPGFVTTNQLVMSFDVVADAKIDVFDPINAEVSPLTDAYFLTHEAGVKDMKRWLGEDESQILARRANFITYLRNSMGVSLPPDKEMPPEAAWVDNSFWDIVPYSESHNTDLRLVTGVGLNNEPLQFNFSRVIEVGFKYTSSSKGLIKQGVYIFENCTDDDYPSLPCAFLAAPPQVNFKSITPTVVNELNQAFIYEDVELVKYPQCKGIYQAVSMQDDKDQNVHDTYFSIVGSFKFYGCPQAMADAYKVRGLHRLLEEED